MDTSKKKSKKDSSKKTVKKIKIHGGGEIENVDQFLNSLKSNFTNYTVYDKRYNPPLSLGLKHHIDVIQTMITIYNNNFRNIQSRSRTYTFFDAANMYFNTYTLYISMR